MITNFSLENWKSYARASFYIDPLSVLIGTNSSGKSNALDALSLLNRLASGASITASLVGDAVQRPLRGGVEWAARKPLDVFGISVTCRYDDHTDYEYRIDCRLIDKHCEVEAESLTRKKFRIIRGAKRKNVGEIKLFKTDLCVLDSPTIVARLYNEKKGSPRILGRSQALLFQLSGQVLRQEIQDGINEVLKSLKEIFILDPIPSHMRTYSALAEQLDPDASNIAGVLAGLPAERRCEIEDTLTRYASKLPERDVHRVYAETVGKFHSDAMLYSEEIWEGGSPPTIDARGMSDGTLRFLAILTALLTRPEGSLLVIEEVDNGLHPSRAQLLLDMLKNIATDRHIDVLVTTHNPALLDAMGPEMVPFITVAHRNGENGASTLTLLENLAQLPKLLAQGQIGTLSSQGLIEKNLAIYSRRGRQLELPHA